MMMNNLLLEGKAKKVVQATDPDQLILQFKDSLTAFNAQKKAELPGKGAINAKISGLLFQFLESRGVKTHFLDQPSTDTLLVKKLHMLKLEVIVRNRASGSFCKRLGVADGTALPLTIVQYHLKDDNLCDPILTEDEVFALALCDSAQLRDIRNLSLYINALLKGLYDLIGIELVDFKLEFGVDEAGNLLLGDELCPDNMRLWEKGSHKRLDKDRFRLDLGDVLESYSLVASKLEELLSGKETILLPPFPVKVALKIKPQPGLLDPVGRTLTEAAKTLGFKSVEEIKAGKDLQLALTDYQLNLIPELCERILVSPAAEIYTFEIESCL
ncbi:MAG: phosphoribosylaminoimidazolesuccinocarboxamide synthase [Candidatus Caenarcaniphilales bacterium]|nr:phosphoribosylaminoimidazolesuccinocarboxamide synthase [Candidatus Caenarcaniphilales bacterium]